MSTTTVLLREDVDNLGGRGEIVKVKAGYARNFLLPRNLATLATKGNIRQIEQEKAALLRKAAAERSTAEAQAEQLKGLSLSFERKAGEEGALFGSVTTMDIAEAIQGKGYEIDRRRLVLKDAIKHTGEYTVGWKLHRDVTVDIPVTVTAEGGEAPTADAAKAEAKPKKKAEAPAEESTTESATEAPEESAAEPAQESAAEATETTEETAA
jgi:large subunit ribosomal protein L9